MSESPLTRQGLPPVLADLVRFYCRYPVSDLLVNYPVSGRISYWYPAGYRIIALLAVTSSSRNTPLIVVVLGEDHDDVTSNYELLAITWSIFIGIL